MVHITDKHTVMIVAAPECAAGKGVVTAIPLMTHPDHPLTFGARAQPYIELLMQHIRTNEDYRTGWQDHISARGLPTLKLEFWLSECTDFSGADDFRTVSAKVGEIECEGSWELGTDNDGNELYMAPIEYDAVVKSKEAIVFPGEFFVEVIEAPKLADIIELPLKGKKAKASTKRLKAVKK